MSPHLYKFLKYRNFNIFVKAFSFSVILVLQDFHEIVSINNWVEVKAPLLLSSVLFMSRPLPKMDRGGY